MVIEIFVKYNNNQVFKWIHNIQVTNGERPSPNQACKGMDQQRPRGSNISTGKLAALSSGLQQTHHQRQQQQQQQKKNIMRLPNLF